MSVSHKLLDESDESLPDHDVAGVEQGGGGEPPGRAEAAESKTSFKVLLSLDL